MNLTHAQDASLRRATGQGRAHTIRIVLGIVASLVYLIVRTHTPITLHAELAHDDQLFMSMGQHIASGQWLGEYDQRTLIKGPGYPLFLALNAWLGTPLSLASALFMGGSIAWFFWIFAGVSRMPNMALFGYIATLWMPAPYLDRIMRDSIYPGQMLLIVAGMLAVLFIDMSAKRRCACALATGLIAGWFCLTREEGVWIAPGVAIMFAAAFLQRRHTHDLKRLVLIPLGMIVIGYGITQLSFATANKLVYGSFVRVETVTAPFTDALAALQSVQAGPQIPYVPVSRQAREAVYKVSPAFASLKDSLDPPSGSPWQFGCRFYPGTCGDIAGGWFQWAVRDAASNRGLYRSPKTAADFYRQLTSEIKTACHQGKLQCKPLTISMIPRIAPSQWSLLPHSVLGAIAMVTLKVAPPAEGFSTGSLADLMSDLALLGSPLRSPSANDMGTYAINGWYYGRDIKSWITGKLTSGNTVADWPINRDGSPDLVSGFKDPNATQQRFSTVISCQTPCILSVLDEKGETIDLRLADEAGHASNRALNGAMLNIDRIEQVSGSSSIPDTRYRFAQAWRKGMIRAYAHVLPWLLPVSLLAMLLALALCAKQRALTATVALASALWALFASRLVLLGLVDISSFPALIVPYLSPGYVLACATPLLSFAALYEQLVHCAETSRRIPGPAMEHI